MDHQRSADDFSNYPQPLTPPVMTREAFAAAIGLPLGVLVAQCDRGYWPQVTKGKRVFINVEAVRLEALQRAREAGL